MAVTPLAPLATKLPYAAEEPGISWSGWMPRSTLEQYGVYRWRDLEEVVTIRYNEMAVLEPAAVCDLLAARAEAAIDALAIRAGLK